MLTTTKTPLEEYTRASLDKKDAERRQDQYLADAMGEVRTINESGDTAVALGHQVMIIRGTQTLDVHGTLKAIAAARNIPDLKSLSQVEALLTHYARINQVDLVYSKRADSLRVL